LLSVPRPRDATFDANIADRHTGRNSEDALLFIQSKDKVLPERSQSRELVEQVGALHEDLKHPPVAFRKGAIGDGPNLREFEQLRR
jgi:hypothetical protein